MRLAAKSHSICFGVRDAENQRYARLKANANTAITNPADAVKRVKGRLGVAVSAAAAGGGQVPAIARAYIAGSSAIDEARLRARRDFLRGAAARDPAEQNDSDDQPHDVHPSRT